MFIMSRDWPDKNNYRKLKAWLAYKTVQYPVPQSVLHPPFGVWAGERIKPQDKEGKHLGSFNFTVFMGVESTLCSYQK